MQGNRAQKGEHHAKRTNFVFALFFLKAYRSLISGSLSRLPLLPAEEISPDSLLREAFLSISSCYTSKTFPCAFARRVKEAGRGSFGRCAVAINIAPYAS